MSNTNAVAPSAAKTDAGSIQVEVLFKGVETPKRLQNAEDIERGIVRHTFDVPAKMLDADVLLGLDSPKPSHPEYAENGRYTLSAKALKVAMRRRSGRST